MNDSALEEMAAKMQAMSERMKAAQEARRMSETDPLEDAWFPGSQWHSIGDGAAFWKHYKHWGQCVWAGEGLTSHNGDGSGCMRIINGMRMTNIPIVVEARTYRPQPRWRAGMRDISAVFSYPMGLGAELSYFWEVYDGEDIARFTGETAEADMESWVLAYFAQADQEAAH